MSRASAWTVFLAGAALMLFGIALGAVSQEETFLGEELEGTGSAAGALVILTGIVVAVGAMLATMACLRSQWRRRVVGASAIGVMTWWVVVLVQTDFPNYDALAEQRTAHVVQSGLLLEGPGAASVFLPVMALMLLLIMGIRQACRWSSASEHDVDASLRRYMAAVALAAPFLLIAAIGAVQVVLSVPAGRPGAALSLVLLPLAAAAALTLLIVFFVRLWALEEWRRKPHLAPVTRVTWGTLDLIQWAAFGLLALAALLSTIVPRIDTEATGIGRTLVFTLRSHGQGLVFAAVACIPAWRMQRHLRRALVEDLRAARRSWPDVLALTAITVITATSVIIVAWTTGSGLLPWIVVLVPLALFAGIRAGATAAVPLQLLAAWALWAEGNTVVAVYDGFSVPILDFLVAPGLLAMWRVAAAAMFAWALTRLISAHSRETRRSIITPLALAFGIGAALVMLLEMPLAVWSQNAHPVDMVAVGSSLQAQDLGVQRVIHFLATLFAAGSAVAAARLLRPDWFGRRPKTIAASAPAAVVASPVK